MHRAMDMLCLNFGETFQEKIVRIGNQVISRKVFPEYSLHLQTQWRFICDNQIILGSRDIYTPFSDNAGDDWDYAPQGRPDTDSSIFDVVSKRLAQDLTGHYVVKSTLSPFGDIFIQFSNGYRFEAFIPASAKDEEWRLIDSKSDEHLVFYDC